MLAAESEEKENKGTAEEPEEAEEDDDIDSETAMNTVYNLLNELGDLNRTNRKTAERLAEKFSTLQTQVNSSHVDADTDTKQTMTDLAWQDMVAENEQLRGDKKLLMQALRDHQEMAHEYETTLAKSLRALRTAAFERAQSEITEVQSRYRELLDAEAQLNERLLKENLQLKQALSSTRTAIRTTLED